MMFPDLLPHQRRFGYLVSHTRYDGVIQIPLTNDPGQNALIRHWATGNGRFVTEEFTADGAPHTLQGDAWEPPNV